MSNYNTHISVKIDYCNILRAYMYFILILISVYNTCTLILNNEKYVNANLDAPDYNAISGNEPSSEMLTSQSRKLK